MTIKLHNPHSVLTTLERRPQDVLEVCVLPSEQNSTGSWADVCALAQKNRIPVKSPQFGGSGNRDRGRGNNQEANRGAASEALIRECQPVDIETLFANAAERANGKGLWLALDCLQDPQNVGAIFRAAAFFGVQGILITQDRSASLTGTVYDVASGGVECVPFAMVGNLQNAFKAAKDAGLWILGSSEHAKAPLTSLSADRPWLLVLGNEEKGMRRLTEENCDELCAIKGAKGAGVTSLNVSVAAGILISHFCK